MAAFVQTGTGQTDLAVNNKLKNYVQSPSDRVASLIFIIMWLWFQKSLITLDNLKKEKLNKSPPKN